MKDALIQYIDDIGAHFSIKNDLLLDETDYIKELYFKMICFVLTQDKIIQDSQKIVISRLSYGSNISFNMSDMFTKALSIEIKDVENFVDQFKNKDLKYRFVLDALVLLLLNDTLNDSIILIVKLSELLSIKKEEMLGIARLAKVILDQKNDSYMLYDLNKCLSISKEVYDGYLSLLSFDKVIYNEQVTLINNLEIEDFNTKILQVIKDHRTPIIKVLNSRISLKDISLVFGDYKEVIFENCEFSGNTESTTGMFGRRKNVKENNIEFKNINKITIKNCTFENFNTRILIVENIEKIIIQNSRFYESEYSYEDRYVEEIGLVIYSKDSKSIGYIEINECYFYSLRSRNHGYGDPKWLLCNCEVNVNNSKFDACNGYYNTYNKYSGYYGMFSGNSKVINCVVSYSDMKITGGI